MNFIKSILVLLAAFQVSTTSVSAAEWTIMVYMNGNNDLEPDTKVNLNQMATVGSTPDINIVVQIARKSAANVIRGRVVKTNPSADPTRDLAEKVFFGQSR